MNLLTTMTTAPRKVKTWRATRDSLMAANLPHPLIVNDNESRGAYWNFQRALRISSFGWRNGLITKGHILIVQDDCQFSANLRSYLNINPPPENSIASLYTSAYNHKPDFFGWHHIHTAPDCGPIVTYGALALLIPLDIAERFIADPPLPNKPHGTDHQIGLFCRREGIDFYTHSPSLVKHTGEVSSILNPGGMAEYRQCAEFCEDCYAKVSESATG